MLDRLDETIVAVSSAPGRGAMGILRLSGPRAIEVADGLAVFPEGRRLRDPASWIRVRGELRIASDACVPADYYLFRGPNSYTRQDVVEIHTIGSPLLLELARKRAIESGAIPALAGEFTARAFLSGRIDLTAAEAVAGVIRAESDAQLRAARRLMDGTLAERLRALRDGIGELLALVEADIDFAEEPIDFITPGEVVTRLAGLRRSLEEMCDGPLAVERIEALPRILLFGPPNAGKSTLVNRLSGTDRAICAAVAGTTRDILSAPVSLGRIDAVLLDGAGIDRSQDEIISQARSMVFAEADRVDALCIVLDVNEPPDPAFLDSVRRFRAVPRVVAVNKCDLLGRTERGIAEPGGSTLASDPSRTRPLIPQAFRERIAASIAGPESHTDAGVILVSAETGEGIDALRAALEGLLGDRATTSMGESILLSERQHSALRAASDALARVESLAKGLGDTIDGAELLAFEMREALDALGSVTGEVTTEDLLSQVFSRFCIGK